jgi:N-acetylmuramic acid 6-phosphate etherase
LLGFENQNNPSRVPSLSYLRLPLARTPAEAWKAILLREPITLEWDELRGVGTRERLLGFDFSAAALGQREKLCAPKRVHRFLIERGARELRFELEKHRHAVDLYRLHPLFEHVFLKVALNMHSLLVMGRYGRFESNVMTWVKSSNNKLIDRSIRYVEHLLHNAKCFGISYEDICYELFEQAEKAAPNESVVLRTVEALRKR